MIGEFYIPDFEEISEHLDLERYLSEVLEIDFVKKVGKKFKVRCPNPWHIDKDPSCYVNTDSLYWTCYGCHEWGSILDLTRLYTGLDQEDAITLLESNSGTISDGGSGIIRRRSRSKLKEVQLSSHYRRDWKNAPYKILNYIKKRQLDLTLFEQYYIGYNTRIQSITIPVIYRQKIVNVIERLLNPDEGEGKYKFKSNSALLSSVWGMFKGFDQKTEPYFTEGVFDAIRLRKAGYNAYSLLSNRLPIEKVRLILDEFRSETFTVVPDNNDGGKLLKEEWKQMLNYKDVYVLDVHPYDDVDEMSSREIHSAVKKRKPLGNTQTKTTHSEEPSINRRKTKS